MLWARGRDQSYAAADQEHRRGDLPSTRPPLVIPHGSEDVLQVVVGARDVGSRVAHEQTWPIARCHLEEVAHRRLERTHALGALAHGCEQASVGSPQPADVTLRRVVQEMRGLVQPAKGGPDRWPLVGGGGCAVSDQVAHSPEVAREPLFSATRSREA